MNPLAIIITLGLFGFLIYQIVSFTRAMIARSREKKQAKIEQNSQYNQEVTHEEQV